MLTTRANESVASSGRQTHLTPPRLPLSSDDMSVCFSGIHPIHAPPPLPTPQIAVLIVGFLGLSLNERTILFLLILLDNRIRQSQSDKTLFALRCDAR